MDFPTCAKTGPKYAGQACDVGHKENTMPNYSFRVRFYRSPTDSINIEAPRWEWSLGDKCPSLILCSHNEETPIKDAEQLIFKSDGWPSESDAANAATKYTDALTLTLAKLRVGADFGNRAPKSFFSNYWLSLLGAQTGSRLLNNVHGLMVFETEPPPRFMSTGGKFLCGVGQDNFERVFARTLDCPKLLSDRELLSLELYNASFFHKLVDTRFLLLVMAVEALLEPHKRSPAANSHVESLIKATQQSLVLSSEEKKCLLGSLRWLYYESINQAGRRLAQERLGTRLYANKSASSFFSYCYKLRSRLVHGEHPPPSQQELGGASAEMKLFVSDLLTGDLTEGEPS
jgi:hypothetical protein